MNEFDDIGREAFLAKYGFGPAKSYFLEHNGKRYDSKAIYGAAHQIQFPEAGMIKSSDFTGGEHFVVGPLKALGFEFDVQSTPMDVTAGNVEAAALTAHDIALIASSRGKNRYAELSDEERSAYARATEALKQLGNLVMSQLSSPEKFELRLTSGFNVKSGVRSFIPKDLWFSVSPKENMDRLAGLPQLFMIVSERGVEYGYGASVSPSDFSTQAVKDIVRKAAPIVFEQLPEPGSQEAGQMQSALEDSGNWYFQSKHRLPPNQSDFSSFQDWLVYLQSAEGKKKAAGSISRYFLPDEVSFEALEAEVAEMARLFEPLLDRDWQQSGVTDEANELDMSLADALYGNEFAQKLSAFIDCYGRKRNGSFAVDAELKTTIEHLEAAVGLVANLSERPHLKIKISVGQGSWTKTPWIALLDMRETTSTQRGVYVVFLIAEDLSVTYLTLNQGMTDLRNSLGQKGAAEKMVRVAEEIRPLITELREDGFALDNEIDLRSDTGAAKNYEIGTIAHVALPSDDLPADAAIHEKLEALLNAYDGVLTDRIGRDDSASDPEISSPKAPPAAPYSIDDALEELFLEEADVTRYLDIWRNKKNLILQGAPGVGKSFIARRLAYALIGFKDDQKVQTVQFHQSYSYEDFVQGYRPNGSNGFELQNGSFYEFRDRAVRDKDGTYVFIIDEINRGNLSKIFGELMLLIEPDKRGSTWATRLAYAGDDDPDFYVPDNLYILGMMNTADRSLSLVDYALRRRFAFVAMDPLYSSPKYRTHLVDRGVTEEIVGKIVGKMSELNAAIEADRTNLGPGFRIGHSFFTPSKDVLDPEAWYRRIVETEIHPLLEEYWFDAPETADQWREQLLG